MPTLLQFDFPMKGPWGDDLAEAFRDLAAIIERSPGLRWKIWTENEDEGVGGGIYLFEDDDFLRSRLVVPAPDRADVIAEWALGALAERAEIVRAYRRWAPAYNERARKSLEEFLRG